MNMTENEIVRNYREAKNKREQVTILADFNRCEKEEIVDILLKNGVDQKELPRKRKPRKKPEEERKAHSATDTVASILAQRVMEIDKKLSEHYAEVGVLEREKADIITYINNLTLEVS